MVLASRLRYIHPQREPLVRSTENVSCPVTDRLTPERRSWNMGRIRGKDTKPEMIVRRLLHRLGYRYRLHQRHLPGAPDMVLSKHRTVIFVHGCFWHRHPRCQYAYNPKSRIEFWQRKFAENVARDQRAKEILQDLGWNVVTVWECETKQLDTLASKLQSAIRRTVAYDFEGANSLPRAAEDPGKYGSRSRPLP